MKKRIAVFLSVVLLIVSAAGTMVFAEDAKTVVEGIRWFPCEPGRENDEIWEVEYEAEGCLCQRFNDNVDTTGFANYLDTVYNEDGSLTICRNGVDGKGEHYWPRIRTLSLEAYPEMDLNTANTLYFDFEATNCQWMISISINGIGVGLAKDISEACGVTGVTDSITDGNAGHYQGSINLKDAFERIATETTANALSAATLLSMKKTFVPQLQIYYVGGTEGEITINSLFISSEDDPEGAKCDYLDMGLLMGDDIYDLPDEPEEDTKTDETTKATTTSAATTTAADAAAENDDGNSLVWIIAGVIAVVVIGGVAVIVLRKKGS